MDPPFTALHRCAVALGVDVTALIEGQSTKLSGYIITRKGQGDPSAIAVKRSGADLDLAGRDIHDLALEVLEIAQA